MVSKSAPLSGPSTEPLAPDRPPKTATIRYWEIAAVIAVAAFVLFLKLGVSPLADWDEAIYAQISREIVDRHSWIPLYWNFQPWFEKPPLLMWTTALFFDLFGVSEFWARAASALSGIGVCVVMFVFAKRLANTRTAWLTVTVLLTTVGFYDAARFGTTDVMLTLGMYVGLLGLFYIGQDRLWGWYPFWIGFGIAVMTKGAAAAPFFLTAVCIAAINRWTKEKLNRQFAIGVMLFCAIVLPWHIYMWAQYGNEFLGSYIGLNVVHRALTSYQGHHGGPRFYLLVLAERGWPWVFFLPLAFIRVLKDRRLQIPVIFSLVVLIFYTLIGTKLFWYIVPVYPAFALIIAVQLDEVLQGYPRLALLYPAGIAAFVAGFLSLSLRNIHGFNEAREDLKLLVKHEPKQYSGAILLCSDLIDPPVPADVYYGRKEIILTYFESRPPSVSPEDTGWRSISNAIKTKPELALIDRKSLPFIPPFIQCRQIAADKDFVLAMLSRNK